MVEEGRGVVIIGSVTLGLVAKSGTILFTIYNRRLHHQSMEPVLFCTKIDSRMLCCVANKIESLYPPLEFSHACAAAGGGGDVGGAGNTEH